MTTAYSTNLGLALPVEGELAGTWGDTVNNGITEYTDISIAGTLTLNGDGAVTLANTNGNSSSSNIGSTTAQYAILKITGTTGTKTITAPSSSKTYTVINASSYAVVIKASGQTGVTIPAGDKAFVAFNGTDYVRVGASAGGADTQVQYNSGGNLAGSANLTFDGTTLTANTLTAKFKAYTEEVVTVGTVTGSTYNIDLSLANIFDITLGNNVTFTFTNAPASGISRNVTVILRQDVTGNRNATFTNAKYTDGVVPIWSTGANEIDVATFFTVDGGSFWFGTYAMANVS